MKIRIEWKLRNQVVQKWIQNSQISFNRLQSLIKSEFKQLPTKFYIFKNEDDELVFIKDQQSLNKVILKSLVNKNENNEQKTLILKLEVSEFCQKNANQEITDLVDRIQEIGFINCQNMNQENVRLASLEKNKIQPKKGKNNCKIQSVIKRLQKITIEDKEKKDNIAEGKRKRSTLLKNQDKSSDSSDDSLSYSQSQMPKIVEQMKIIHLNIQCSKCQAKPIYGVRWKCTICANYDLCQKCQQTQEHVHCLLKIKKPELLPSQIVNKTVLKGSNIKWQFSSDLSKLGHNASLNRELIGKKQAKQAKRKKKNQQYIDPQIVNQSSFQAIIVSKANELSQLLGVQIDKCLIISQKHPFKDISQLVDEYFKKAKTHH